MKTNAIDKDFSCLRMKNDIQAEVYAEIKDMNANERIAYYKKGTKEFWNSPLPIQNQILVQTK